MFSQAHSLGVLAYASPQVKSSPPRTSARLGFAALGSLVKLILRGVCLLMIGCGYAVLGVSMLLRVLLGGVAIGLLYLGGMRWERVKARSMSAGNWIDRKTLAAVQFLRAPLAPRASAHASANA